MANAKSVKKVNLNIKSLTLNTDGSVQRHRGRPTEGIPTNFNQVQRLSSARKNVVELMETLEKNGLLTKTFRSHFGAFVTHADKVIADCETLKSLGLPLSILKG